MQASDSSVTWRRLGALSIDALVVVLALIGVLTALNGSSAAGLICVLAALLITVGQLLWTRYSERGTSWNPLGRALVLRSTASVATAVVLTLERPGVAHALAAGLAAAVQVGAIVCEPFIARAARYAAPVAVRLPGLPTPPARHEIGIPAVTASLVATAIGLLLAVLEAPAGWWLAAAALAGVPLVLLTLEGRAMIGYGRRLRRLVPKAVADYAPDFVVYTSRPDDASYQIMMWLPYLQRAGLRLMIVTRNRVPAEALAGLTDVPVVEARGIGDLDALVVPSLQAVFYVNASSGNGAFVRFQHLTHIYLGHGDSDKPPSYNPTHAMYDEIFAAGPAAARRYAAHGVNIPPEKFRIVGRPQVEDVHPVTREIGEISSPVVLYAPTWRGHVEETMLYSLPSGEQIVTALLARGATVIFRPHPFSYDFAEDAAVIGRIQQRLAADARSTGRAHRWGAAAEKDLGILDCINVSDAMVSDVSSVVSDYLFSGKPFAMIAVPAEPDRFVEEFPVARASYVVRGDLADLEARLDAMLGVDPLAERRRAIRNDYLGDFPAENYANAFVDAVRHVTGKTMDDMDDDRGEESEEEAGTEPGESNDDDSDDAEDSRGGGRNWSRYRSFARRAGLDLVGTGLALIALTTVLIKLSVPGLPSWVPVVFAVLSIWAAFQSVSSTVRNPGRWSRLLTEGDATRGVLVVTLAVLAWIEVGPNPSYSIGALLIMISIVVERRIRSLWGTRGLMVRNLDSALTKITQLTPRGALPLIGSLVVLIGFVGAWLHLPGVIFLVLAAIVFVIFVEITARALWRAVEVERAEHRLPAALAAYAPEFAVYFASTVGASYQVGMWLPYFQRIGRPFIFVTRTVPMLRQIAKLCEEAELEIPIIFRPTLRSVEEVVVPTMTSAFYVNNAVRNTHFIERRELTHVWLNHGDSEKPACFNPVHAIYDLLFVAGQAGIDRYERHGVHIPEAKFRIVGRPQVERIGPARGPIGELAEPTVLYAPTWQGPFADSRVFSLPVGTSIVSELLSRGARVIFRAHPFNYRYPEVVAMINAIGALLDADRATTGREHLWGPAAEQEMTIEDCFNASDAMISDVSAVVSDYLHAAKPFAIVSVGRTPEELLVDVPAARAAYVLREDLENLEQVCTDLLGPDPLAQVRLETKIYYLGDFPDANYAEGFLSTARAVIAGSSRS